MNDTADTGNIMSVAELYKKRDDKIDRYVKAGSLSEEEWQNRDRTNESAEDEIVMTIFRHFVREWEKDREKEKEEEKGKKA